MDTEPVKHGEDFSCNDIPVSTTGLEEGLGDIYVHSPLSTMPPAPDKKCI